MTDRRQLTDPTARHAPATAKLTVTLDLPESVLAALRASAKRFGHSLEHRMVRWLEAYSLEHDVRDRP